MTKQEEVAFEAKADKHFKSQRELPYGRDFRWNQEKDVKAERKFRNNFDNVFPNAPGAGI